MNEIDSKLSTGLDSFFNDDASLSLDLTLNLDAPKDNAEKFWKILIVDDEPEVHSVTKLSLNYFEFDGRGLQFHNAYSGAEARRMLREEPGFALILLDVVMETDDSGLQVVDFIRHELQNKYVRIVLRTGQPGAAPEEEVVSRYDIDDYKAKTELTAKKLTTTVVSALRAYRELQRVDQLVRERTAELVKVNRDITDSILAAQRIQTAILPSTDYIAQFLPNFFVFYRPKDIVSGDFYWFSQFGSKSVIANIDCTGHGVPGAIMSVFSYNLLKHVVDHQRILDPASILSELDRTLKVYLNNSQKGLLTNGMDMSVAVIDHENQLIELASANHPVYLARNGELREIPGDRMPIGESYHSAKEFTTQKVQMQPNDRLYLFTDGITDQFGGEMGRKYSAKRLQDFILSVQHLSLSDQLVELSNEFDAWKQNYPQTDDICFIGLQLM